MKDVSKAHYQGNMIVFAPSDDCYSWAYWQGFYYCVSNGYIGDLSEWFYDFVNIAREIEYGDLCPCLIEEEEEKTDTYTLNLDPQKLFHKWVENNYTD